MLNALLALIPIALFIGMAWVLKTRSKPTADDHDDSVEVFKGPSDAALMAIDSLAEAGVAAWIDSDDGSTATVHVDAEAAPQVPTLLRVAQAQSQQAAQPAMSY